MCGIARRVESRALTVAQRVPYAFAGHFPPVDGKILFFEHRHCGQ